MPPDFRVILVVSVGHGAAVFAHKPRGKLGNAYFHGKGLRVLRRVAGDNGHHGLAGLLRHAGKHTGLAVELEPVRQLPLKLVAQRGRGRRAAEGILNGTADDGTDRHGVVNHRVVAVASREAAEFDVVGRIVGERLEHGNDMHLEVARVNGHVEKSP